MTQTKHPSSSPNSEAVPTALYHGACPICGSEVRHYQRYCETQNVSMAWSDISEGVPSEALARAGLEREDAKRRMTVLGADGTIHRGVDAFVVLWGAMPRYRWMARGVSLPGVYQIATLVYDRLLAPGLYAWNKRSGR